jgi:hypothetical protein
MCYAGKNLPLSKEICDTNRDVPFNLGTQSYKILLKVDPTVVKE